jgi:hypothetical protein
MSDAVCPSHDALMDHHNGSDVYFRVAFQVYWQNMSPGIMIFYLAHPRPFSMSYDGLESLKAFVKDAISQNVQDNAVVDVEYISHGNIQMTAKNVADAGWHVLQVPHPAKEA